MQVRIYSGAVDETVRMLPIWVSVTERLPESGKNILAYSRGGDFGQISWYDLGYFFNGKFRLNNPLDDDDKVTHWMPLPAPPKEEK